MSNNQDEIAVGDKVLYTSSPEEWHVLAIDEDLAWCKTWRTTGYTTHSVHRGILLASLTKVMPLFEARKRYRLPQGEKTVFVVEATDAAAIGWWSNGEPWFRRQCLRKEWVEV